MDPQIIETFADGGRRLREACEGLSGADVMQRVAPGTWSALELVVHLADSDAIAIDRMKRILTEDNPALLAADETAYVQRLHPHEQSLDDALELFDVGRRQFARVLRRLSAEDFQRTGTHNRAGVVCLAGLVQGYIDHLEHHLTFLRGKRRTLGR